MKANDGSNSRLFFVFELVWSFDVRLQLGICTQPRLETGEGRLGAPSLLERSFGDVRCLIIWVFRFRFWFGLVGTLVGIYGNVQEWDNGLVLG